MPQSNPSAAFVMIADLSWMYDFLLGNRMSLVFRSSVWLLVFEK